jgi:hypothetical protein
VNKPDDRGLVDGMMEVSQKLQNNNKNIYRINKDVYMVQNLD